MKLPTICDICKFGTEELGFDDVHKGMNAPTWLYAFMCKECRAINDGFWTLAGVSMRVEMEISMIKRAFRRNREELCKNI